MNPSDQQVGRFITLCGRMREGIISEAEIAEMNQILETQPQAQDYYIDYVFLCTDLYHLQVAANHRSLFRDILHENGKNIGFENFADVSVLLETLKLLGEDERKAEAIAPCSQEHESSEQIPGRIEHVARRVNKVPLYTALLATAAMIMLFVYVYLNPRNSMEVATLADSIGAEWNTGYSFGRGDRITAEIEPVKLQKGVIELVTDEDVRIVIESPAEFRFASASQIILNYGRLYSSVMQTGRGFTVQTPSSKIIDLGTEFGVSADMHGATELHVFRGKTVFIGGSQSLSKEVIYVAQGEALRLDPSGTKVSNIHLNDNSFVRSIDSRIGLLWRGQTQINLADVVSGGDGFGPGKVNFGIDPVTGKFSTAAVSSHEAPNTYTPVKESIYIDGVFVPNGRSKQVISSAGHVFQNCPPTSGSFYSFIVSCPRQKGDMSLFLNEMNCSELRNPCIYLHSNLGITFDLDAFRRRFPQLKIAQFQSQVGVSNSVSGAFNVDIWVLVDGEVRYQRTGITQTGVLDFLNIDIHDNDRFLTLITTEGENTQDNVSYSRPSTGYDWVLFARPVLSLEGAEQLNDIVKNRIKAEKPFNH